MNLTQEIFSKIARRARKLIRSYILAVIYFVMLPIIALAGSKLALTNSGKSGWREWGMRSEPPLVKKQSGKSWILRYLAWAFRTKNIWAISVLPFILILKGAEEPSGAPSEESLMIYTLF